MVAGHISQRQKPSLICCVLTCLFHSFFDVKVDWQPYAASGQGKGRRRPAEVDFFDLLGLVTRVFVDEEVESLLV